VTELRIVTNIIEYLGETDIIFEKHLWDESGDQMSSFDEKKNYVDILTIGHL
jgi:hypothetical protein